jgi:hypothetical protein
MLLSPVVEGLKSDLEAAAAVGGEEVQRTAGILLGALEAAVRFRVLDVLQEAADEVSASLPGLRVEVRMAGREPALVASLVTEPEAGARGEGDDRGGGGDDASDAAGPGEIARITLRLSESLKSRVEQAASRKSVSVNNWLVAAASQALALDTAKRMSGKRISGFVRG